MSSCGWKGEAYNEFHVHALSTSVEGEALDLLMHYIHMGVQGGETPPFWDLLEILICTYIKKSAAVASTKSFN
jgi:hypothetical protein